MIKLAPVEAELSHHREAAQIVRVTRHTLFLRRNMYGIKLLFCVILYFATRSEADVRCGDESSSILSSETTVSIKSCAGDISIPGSIPGNLHLDLLRAGKLLNGEPLFRFNELEYSWIVNGTACWRYVIEGIRFDDTNPLFLRLSAIDTVSVVTLNDRVIGKTNNAFRR